MEGNKGGFYCKIPEENLTCECCGKKFSFLLYDRICRDCLEQLLTIGIEALKNRNGWAGK